jgi:hypothetical protein
VVLVERVVRVLVERRVLRLLRLAGLRQAWLRQLWL